MFYIYMYINTYNLIVLLPNPHIHHAIHDSRHKRLNLLRPPTHTLARSPEQPSERVRHLCMALLLLLLHDMLMHADPPERRAQKRRTQTPQLCASALSSKHRARRDV